MLGKETGFGFMAGYVCHGNTSHCVPHDVELLIKDQVNTYEGSHDWIFLVDGKRLPPLKIDWKIHPGFPRQETVDASATITIFKQIASGKSVEGKVGAVTFKFSDKALAELKTLANEMKSR